MYNEISYENLSERIVKRINNSFPSFKDSDMLKHIQDIVIAETNQTNKK